MSSTQFRLFAILTILFLSGLVARVPADDTAAQDRMRKDLTYLASDECEGRGVSTKGNALAGDYIAAEFKRLGLKPAGKDGTYFQPFTITGSTLEDKPTLILKGANDNETTLKEGKDFEPLGFSASGKLDNLPLVFVGYGLTITAKDKSIVYDDYKDLDVKDKAVLVLRGIFRDEDKEPPLSLTQRQKSNQSSLTEKINNAAKHGAAAVLLVNDHVTAKDGDQIMPFSMFAPTKAAKIPAFQVSRALADEILKSQPLNCCEGVAGLTDVEKDYDKNLKAQSQALSSWKVSGEVKTKQGIDARNIIGVLEGAGPLADQTIVVGAHYDHLGFGGSGSLARLRNPAIHHGADDNGSGSTAVLELARRFAGMKNRQGRRLVFMCFSGEELGLHCSAYYCDHPVFPLEDTAAMFNLDMVGRLSIDKESNKEKVLVQGVGTAKTFNDLVDSSNKKYDFKLVKTQTGFGPSDHSSFYGKKVPVLFYWTGDHDDYHRPSDTADRINYAGMAKIVNMSQEIIDTLATVKDRPEYVRVKDNSSRGGGPRIGISFKEESKDGAVIENVIPHSPADDAGLKPDDRIVQIGDDKPVKNVEGFMSQIREFKAGDEVKLGVVRGDQTIKVKVVPVQLPVFGLRPDYNDDKEGMLLSGVVEGGAAEKAGLKAGDRIIELNGQSVKDLQGYMDSLYTMRPGKPAEIVVMRDGKKVPVKVTPE
jgi:hypothetical protein